MRKEFELRVFEEILNDIKYGYLKNLNKKKCFGSVHNIIFISRIKGKFQT